MAKNLTNQSDKGTTISLFTDIPYLPSANSGFCRDPWESLKISSNGDVSICCYAGGSFGNVFQNDVDGIWNSSKIKHYRATVNTDNPPDACRKCPKKATMFAD
jgi:radical SAM protein with 4Fe4S-binding SPASM domain